MEVGCRALKGETTRKLQGFLKDQVQAYHGDYGVACVQQSLTSKWVRELEFTLDITLNPMQSNITISRL